MHLTRARSRAPGARLAALLAAVLTLGVLWRWGPLAQALTLDDLVHAGTMVRSASAGPIGLLAVFVLASLAGIPVVLLIVCAQLLLGPGAGFLCALAGSVLSAALGFGIGRGFGPEAVRRLTGDAVDRVSRRLARQGFLAVLAVRLLPIAPFTVVNVIAGATHIRLRHFLLGTVAGMAPGIAGLAFFSQQALDVLAAPSAQTLVRLVAVIVLLAAAAFAVHRWLRARLVDEQAG